MEIKQQLKQIKIIATDIDGVLTDGHILLDSMGNELKQICVRDLDAIGAGRMHGLDFILVTGEDNELVDAIAHRFGITQVLRGAKDKLSALLLAMPMKEYRSEEICYIGDSDRDAPAIRWAGLGVAPSDASTAARESADYVTTAKGGDGVLAEVIELFTSQQD